MGPVILPSACQAAFSGPTGLLAKCCGEAGVLGGRWGCGSLACTGVTVLALPKGRWYRGQS